MIPLSQLPACLAVVLALAVARATAALPASAAPATLETSSAKPGDEPAGPSAPLKQAVQLSGRVEDPEFQGILKEQLVVFLLQRGFFERAESLAGSVPEYRGGIALAEVAAARARRDAGEDIAPLLERALSQSGFPHPWQADAIRAEVAIAWAAAGRDDRAGEVAQGISDQAAGLCAKAGIAVERERRGEALEPTTFALPGAADKIAPELLFAARAAIEIAEARLEKKAPVSEIAPLCEQAEEIVRGCRATAGEEWLDLGILWRKLGDVKKSGALVSQAIQHLAPGSEMQGWRPGYFAKIVRLYMDGDDATRVPAMLEVARKGIEKQHAFHQVPGYCQLAEAELASGAPEAAAATWEKAVGVALANPNPDSRYLGAGLVLFSMARTDQEILEKMATLLAPLSPPAKSEAPAVEK